MSITSLNFAGFVIVTLAIYYVLPRRQQNWLLLVMSYVFYVSWAWFYAAILVALTLVNFVLALRIRRENGDGKPHTNRTLLWLGIGVNLATLALLKYEDFFVPDLLDQLNEWNIENGLGALDFLLPVGMSFYIVAVISYLVDVSRGQVEASRDLVDFGVYMAYFPKLVSGPIERARSFMPKLAEQRIVDNDVMARSFTLIVIGVVRKAVIADTLFRTFPVDLWDRPLDYAAPQLIGYLIVYAFALYNDFAGYTSAVRGVSGLFGIELSRNFNLPYTARNLSEFWNRWHITLSHWLRDYIYYPSSRALLRRNPSRTNMANAIFPPVLTMLASGLWHGPGWNMLLWGALHGVYLVGERLLALWRPAGPPDKQPKVRQYAAMLLVFGLVVLAWVPFRTPDIGTAIDYWTGMVDLSNLSQRPSLRILIILIPALWVDWVQYHRDDELVFLRWPRLVQATLLAIAILVTFLITQSDTGAPFVYQGF
jgi:alginate O-acetyltransferase complex protein AlgI